MTTEHQASRTLVKSPPELWAECSEAASLARHIGEFGEIRITRLEPETSVSWEAEHASGTVEIEPSGWGTRVTLTAQTKGTEAVPEPAEAAAAGTSAGVTEVKIETAEPPAAEANSVEEDSDATVEETNAEPDPAVAADADPARGRWKRLIARTRRWFRAGAEVGGEIPVAGVDPPAAEEPPPAEANADPPNAGSAEPEPEPVAVAEVVEVESPAPDEAGDEAEARPPDEPAHDAPAPDPAAVLVGALESLGQAHHRPFSRA
jgi:hypothetical protein